MQPLDPFRFLLISVAGWINQHQRDVIDFLQEENRILRDQLGNKRPRLTDDQRRRLALKAKKLGRKGGGVLNYVQGQRAQQGLCLPAGQIATTPKRPDRKRVRSSFRSATKFWRTTGGC